MNADDTVIYTSDIVFYITSNLTEDFARVTAWLEVNQLIVNMRKEDRTHAVWDVAIDKKTKHLM